MEVVNSVVRHNKWRISMCKEKIYWKNAIYEVVAVLSLVAFLIVALITKESKVSIMTGIKQLSVIEIIILGKLLFKEKNTLKKLAASLLIIFGIVLTLI